LKTSSAKAKGRRASQETKELLLKYTPFLEDGDIIVTPSGVPGPDLLFSPKALKTWPVAIECKNVEALNVWEAFSQAESHQRHYKCPTTPILFFRRNRSELMVCLKADDFMKLVK